MITVGGSDYKKLVNLGGTASGWVGETDTRSQTATSVLGLIEPFMGEIYGNPQATQKMLDDAFFNVEAWINSELATEFAEQEEIAFTTGDGTKKPKGFPPMNPPKSPIRLVRSVNFSTSYPVKRPR